MSQLQANDESEPVAEQFLLTPSEGGKARARKLQPDERARIAREAAQARWSKNVRTAAYTGALVIGERRIDCAVLEDGTRVLAQGTVLSALGRAPSMGRRGDNEAVKRAPFLSANNLMRYVPAELLEQLTPVTYRLPNGKSIKSGYVAEALPGICDVYLEARRHEPLQPRQLQVADAAEVLMRSLAKVGINALVDEATGYQEVRDKDELQRLLSKYVREEFRPWVQVFPDSFFRELYRLYDWRYEAGNLRRPKYVGSFINTHIYEQLPEGVLEELRRVNPKLPSGNRSRKHHQHLTIDTGSEHLDKVITTVITLMQVSDNKQEFDRLFRKKFPPQEPRKVLRVVEQSDGVTTLFELEELNGRDD